MLRLISVRGLATIERAEVELAPGLNVLTGETGAGKSLLIDALSLLLGARADSLMIREGEPQARVEALFLVGDEVRRRLAPLLDGLADESEEELVLSREVNREGRNVCRVNGRIVPLRLLSGVAGALVEVHGQGHHLALFRPRYHLEALDRFAGLEEERARLASLVAELEGVRRELASLRSGDRELARELDLLKYQAEEIESARLRPDEEGELERELTLLSRAEELRSVGDALYASLYAGEGSAHDALSRAVRELARLESADPGLREHRETAEALTDGLEELARALRAYRDSVEADPARLEEVERRLRLISDLKRKYGDTVEEVLEYARRARARMEELAHLEEREAELQAREGELLGEIGRVAGALSQARREAGERLSGEVLRHLAELALEGARFQVHITQQEAPEGVPVRTNGEERRLAFDTTGVDRVEFLLSANPGEPLRPLARIASGGEASRIMLALRVVLAEADRVPTLAFDEVDAGIGGRVGSVVGAKLWTLARWRQVLCVSHLPQLACFADRHIRVEKEVRGGRTVTLVETLSEEARVGELARMLGDSGPQARRNALELMRMALERREALRPSPR